MKKKCKINLETWVNLVDDSITTGNENPEEILENLTLKAEPTKKDNNTKSKTQLMKDLINKKIDEGFELKDKTHKINLQKIVLDELHLPKGSYSDTGKFLKEIMIERGLQISDVGFKDDKIGDMLVNVIKNEIVGESPNSESHDSIPQSSKGALPMGTSPASTRGLLPKTETETQEQSSIEPEKKVMSATAQSKLIHYGLEEFLFPLYKTMGFIELSEEEKKKEAKPMKVEDAKKQWGDLADHIDGVLVENNIQLPQFLNYASLMISIFAVMILPVVKFKFFSSKQSADPKYDESADDIEVKA